MCDLANRPTKRCGGGAFKSYCLGADTTLHSCALAGAIAGDCIVAELYAKGVRGAGVCCFGAVTAGATIVEITTVWSRASDLTSLLDAYQDYTDCTNSLGGMAECENIER